MPGTRAPQTVAGLNDEQVVRLRCARIEDALVEVAVDRGCSAMIVDDVAAQGGLSRKTFYELYDDKAEAFFAAYDAIVHRIATRMRGAAAPHRTPGDRIAAALAELLAIAEAEPTWARFCVIEAQTASALAGDHDRHLRPIVAAVERARAALGAAPTIPPAEQAAMVLGVLRVRLGADGYELADLLPRFFELVSGEEWGDRPPLGERRPQDGDPARAAAMGAALAAGDRAATVELIVEAVVDHDPGAAAVAEAGLDEGSELRGLLRAGMEGGALEVLRHLGLAAPRKE